MICSFLLQQFVKNLESFLHIQTILTAWQWDHPKRIMQKSSITTSNRWRRLGWARKDIAVEKRKFSTLLLTCWLILHIADKSKRKELCIHSRKVNMDWAGDIPLRLKNKSYPHVKNVIGTCWINWMQKVYQYYHVEIAAIGMSLQWTIVQLKETYHLGTTWFRKRLSRKHDSSYNSNQWLVNGMC